MVPVGSVLYTSQRPPTPVVSAAPPVLLMKLRPATRTVALAVVFVLVILLFKVTSRTARTRIGSAVVMTALLMKSLPLRKVTGSLNVVRVLVTSPEVRLPKLSELQPFTKRPTSVLLKLSPPMVDVSGLPVATRTARPAVLGATLKLPTPLTLALKVTLSAVIDRLPSAVVPPTIPVNVVAPVPELMVTFSAAPPAVPFNVVLNVKAPVLVRVVVVP